MKVQLEQRDLANATDALALSRPSNPDRPPTFRETSQVFQQAKANYDLEVTLDQLEAVRDAVTACDCQVPERRRERVRETGTRTARFLFTPSHRDDSQRGVFTEFCRSVAFRSVAIAGIGWILANVLSSVTLTSGFAQATEPTPIAEILSDLDVDFAPDRLGEDFLVRGTATTYPHVARGEFLYVVIQDSTGGLRLLAEDPQLFVGIEPGTIVRASGQLAHRRGIEELHLQAAEIEGITSLPEPRDVLVSDLLSERYAHQLVRVTGYLRGGTEASGDLWGEFRDRSGVIPLRLPARFLAQSDFLPALERGGEVEIVGIAGQSRLEAPWVGGYRLAPRELVDIVFEAVPPYRLIATVVSFVFLLGLAAALWARRRASERRAAELGELLEEVRRSKQAMAATQEIYLQLFEEDLTGHIVMVPSGTVVRCNRAACSTFGFDSEDAWKAEAGFTIWNGDEAGAELLTKLRNTKRLELVEIDTRRIDGQEITVLVNLQGDFTADGELEEIQASLFDITEHKSLERNMVQADKMSSIGRLAAGVAHDFNNLLTIISGSASLLTRHNGPEEKEIVDIQMAVSKAAVLTQRLLAFGRKQHLMSQVFYLNDLIGSIRGLLASLVGERIDLALDLSKEKVAVNTDPGQLEQVIVNLAANARDAMPNGGTLRIESEATKLDDAFVETHSGAVLGDYARLTVMDTGTGMDATTLSHVFEPFYTTKQPGEGTGLGLAMVYGIVKQSEGYVSIDSVLGRGTKVSVYLPKADGPVSPLETPAKTLARGTGSCEILLVEDEDELRTLLCRVLREAGYDPIEASNGVEAISALKLAHGPVPLVVTDVHMPKMNGTALARYLTRCDPELKILFMSGYTESPIFRDKAVASNILQKPFHPDQFLQKVHELIGGSGNRSQGAVAG